MVKDLCIEVIEKCLNNCKFCSSNSNCRKKQEISFSTFKRVIDYFMETGGIQELSLSGGEPLLNKDLLMMVNYAKAKGIKTVIFTSGVVEGCSLSEAEYELLEEERKEKLKGVDERTAKYVNQFYDNIAKVRRYSPINHKTLYRLRNTGLDKIVFDYQAYESETDHKLMGRNEEARFALLKSLITASLNGLNVDVHFVPMKPNYKEIGDILEMLEIAGVKNISILNFIPQGRGRINQKELQLSKKELNEFFELLEKAKERYSGNIRIGIPLQGDNTHKCNAGLEKLDIKFDGTVLPCPAFKEITIEEAEKYGIKLHNIYTDLEEVKIPGEGTRVKPLCKQIYKSK